MAVHNREAFAGKHREGEKRHRGCREHASFKAWKCGEKSGEGSSSLERIRKQ